MDKDERIEELERENRWLRHWLMGISVVLVLSAALEIITRFLNLVRGIRLDVEKGKALLSFSGDWPVVRGLALGDRPGLVPSPVVRLVNLVASY